MKLSTNFVKDYIDINDIDLKNIAEDMNMTQQKNS